MQTSIWALHYIQSQRIGLQLRFIKPCKPQFSIEAVEASYKTRPKGVCSFAGFILLTRNRNMLFCLQFSTSVACGIEQIVERDSLFHTHERGCHAQQYMFARYICIYIYICYFRSKSLNNQASKFFAVLVKTGPGAFSSLFLFQTGKFEGCSAAMVEFSLFSKRCQLLTLIC